MSRADDQAPERTVMPQGQFVFLSGYCGRLEKSDGGVGFIRFDEHSAPGKTQEIHGHFHPLYENGKEIPARSMWADGANVRITAYRYDPERNLVRIKTERTTPPAAHLNPNRRAAPKGPKINKAPE